MRETECPEFYWGLVMQTSFVSHIPKFQMPRRKAVVQHKQHFLKNILVTVSSSSQFWKWWESSQYRNSHISAKGHPSKRPFYTNFRLTILTIFCTQTHLVSLNKCQRLNTAMFSYHNSIQLEILTKYYVNLYILEQYDIYAYKHVWGAKVKKITMK